MCVALNPSDINHGWLQLRLTEKSRSTLVAIYKLGGATKLSGLQQQILLHSSPIVVQKCLHEHNQTTRKSHSAVHRSLTAQEKKKNPAASPEHPDRTENHLSAQLSSYLGN